MGRLITRVAILGPAKAGRLPEGPLKVSDVGTVEAPHKPENRRRSAAPAAVAGQRSDGG